MNCILDEDENVSTNYFLDEKYPTYSRWIMTWTVNQPFFFINLELQGPTLLV